MTSSIPIEIYSTNNQNYNPNIYPSSIKIIEHKNNSYDISTPIYPKHYNHKNNNITLLTDKNYQLKNIVPSLSPIQTVKTKTDNYITSVNSISPKRIYSIENNYPFKPNKVIQRYHSQEKNNIYNLPFIGVVTEDKNDLSFLSSKNDYGVIKHSNTNFFTSNNKLIKNKISKIPHPQISSKKNIPQKTVNRLVNGNYNNYFNYNSHNYSNENISNNYSNTNIIINNDMNKLTKNYLNAPLNKGISFDNYIGEEPGNNFKLSEFIAINRIGEGSEGTISSVKWKKNNKIYALKKSEIIYDDVAKDRKQLIVNLKSFIDETGNDGVIKIYGSLLAENHFGTYYFYELMEKADKDWEQEILKRQKNNMFYQEYELMNIFSHLIKTFSALQLRNITHRDIKPQNIMMVNGTLKICDFGNAKLLKKEGGLIMQKIRGSELFLSPIAFKGLHSGMQTIKHNTFKSDVFSLGMCFFFAASLRLDGLNFIREIYDMKIIKKVLNKFLEKRYSQNLINLILSMLQIEENKRPDFIQLEVMLP